MTDKQNNAGYIARRIEQMQWADLVPSTVQVDLKGHFITVLDKANNNLYRISVTLEA